MHTDTATTAGDLKATLARLKPAIPTNTRVSVLTHVLVGAGVLVGTDMTARVTAPCAAADGVTPTLVSFAALLKAIGACKSGDAVRFHQADGALSLETPHGLVHLPVHGDLEDFPDAPDVAFPFSIVPGDDSAFTSTLLDVASICSTDESRPVLGVVHLSTDADSGMVRLVATDSYVLVDDHAPAQAVGAAFDAHLPALTRYVSKKSRVALVEVTHASATSSSGDSHQRWARLTDADGTVTVLRCPDGRFPEADKLVPAVWESTVRVPGDLADAVRFAKKACDLKKSPLALDFDHDELELTAGEQDGSKFARTFALEGSSVDGAAVDVPVRIGFNADYLLQGLELVGPGSTLSLISPLRPGLLTSRDHAWRRFLIMPVRLAG